MTVVDLTKKFLEYFLYFLRRSTEVNCHAVFEGNNKYCALLKKRFASAIECIDIGAFTLTRSQDCTILHYAYSSFFTKTMQEII